MTLRRIVRPTVWLVRYTFRALQPDLRPTPRQLALTKSRTIAPIVCGIFVCLACAFIFWESWTILSVTTRRDGQPPSKVAAELQRNGSRNGPLGFLILCGAGAIVSGGGALYLLHRAWISPKVKRLWESQSEG